MTERLRRHVERTFPPEDVPDVLVALQDWRIPYLDEPPGERLLAAAVFLADGRAENLVDAFALGESDFRDLLMNARLGYDWWPETLDDRLGPSADG